MFPHPKLLAAFCAIFGLYLLLCSYASVFYIDDAYITGRYARNLVDGFGLVFNPGDAPFEAYSNFLLLLFQAPLLPLGVDPVGASRLLSIIAVLSLFFTFVRYGRAYGTGREPFVSSILALLLVSVNAPFVVWSVGGLETAIYACLLAIIVALGGIIDQKEKQDRAPSPAIVALELAVVAAFLCRSEGFVVAALVAAMQLFSARYMSAFRISLAVVLYLVFKLVYFGDVLPAPYYAKVTVFEPYQGLLRFLLFALMWSTLPLVLAFVVHVLWSLATPIQTPKHIWFGFALVAFTVGYPMSLGYRIAMDDGFRFYAHAVPLLALSVFHVLNRGLAILGRRFLLLAAPVILAAVGGGAWEVHVFRNEDMNWGAFPQKRSATESSEHLAANHWAIAAWIRENTCPDDVIVLHDAGIIPYASNRKIFDTWSLTDPFIVHLKHAYWQGEIDGDEVERRFDGYVAALRYDIVVRSPELIYPSVDLEGFSDVGLRFGPRGEEDLRVLARTGREFPCSER